MSDSNQFSYFKGYSFRFEDDTNIIEPWFSALSGLEKVSVNNQLVAKQRNLSTNSSTSFEIQGNSYKTNLEVKSLFKGPYVCSLFKNGELFKQQQLVFQDPSHKKPWYSKLWFALFVGLGLGVSSAYFRIPFWVALVLIAALGAFNIMKASGQKPRIEDVEPKDI